MYKVIIIPAVLLLTLTLIQIHTVYATQITKDQQAVLDTYCFKLHSTIQDEHIFASTNTDPTLAREKSMDLADSAQYKKVCGPL